MATYDADGFRVSTLGDGEDLVALPRQARYTVRRPIRSATTPTYGSAVTYYGGAIGEDQIIDIIIPHATRADWDALVVLRDAAEAIPFVGALNDLDTWTVLITALDETHARGIYEISLALQVTA